MVQWEEESNMYSIQNLWKFPDYNKPLKNNPLTSFSIKHSLDIELRNLLTFYQEVNYQDNVLVYDNEPSIVDAQISHYKDTNNIKIFFGSTIEKYELERTKYMEQMKYLSTIGGITEASVYLQIALAELVQKYNSYEDNSKKLLFLYENDIDKYECIILDDKKQFYKHYSSKYPNKSLKICLESDKKFYFILYCVDKHKKFSPLTVYSVELVSNLSNYPIIEYIDIDEFLHGNKKEIQELVFKKSLLIEPSNSNYFSYYKLYDDVKAQVDKNEQFWDIPTDSGEAQTRIPKYKFRIKSKKTGRTLDLNVNFEREKINIKDGIDKEQNMLGDSWKWEKITV
jgi:hypothetical protein